MRFFSACPKDCYDSCSIWTDLDDKLYINGNKEHPVTNGFLCYKSKFFVDAYYSEKRVLYPMKAVGKKGEGKFERLEWNKALEIISDKIQETMDTYGPESILNVEYAGNKGLISYYFPQRFFNYLGTAKLLHSACDEAGARALEQLYGSFNSVDPLEILNSELIIYWGINSVWTNVHGYYLAKKSKAYMIAIDPLATETSKKADWHIKIKIGTDITLALGLANYIIKNKKYDKDFISLSTIGFDNFAAKVEKYSLDYTSSITGIKKEDIIALAELYLTKKSIIHIGYGFQRSLHGGDTVKAIAILPALLGNMNGLIYSLKNDLDYKYLAGSNDNRVLIKQSQLGRELKEKNIKFMFVYNSNPFATLPNQEALRDAVKNGLFIVVHDLFFTDSTDFADIVLPATTFFEQNDLVVSYFHNYINLNQKIVEPRGECKSNYELFTLLAKHMKLPDPALIESESEIISKVLSQLNINTEEFYNHGFAKIKVPNSSGKINFNYIDTDLKKNSIDGKFIFLSLTHIKSMHSQFNILTSFDTALRVNRNDALNLGIKDGDLIEVKSTAGALNMTAIISDDIPEGVVAAYKGAWPKLNDGKNINFVVEDLVQERYGSGTALQSTYVSIKKVR
ncbi:MAG: molybdopterin-dependent oxidoreductase [Thermoplasmata archaeon]